MEVFSTSPMSQPTSIEAKSLLSPCCCECLHSPSLTYLSSSLSTTQISSSEAVTPLESPYGSVSVLTPSRSVLFVTGLDEIKPQVHPDKAPLRSALGHIAIGRSTKTKRGPFPAFLSTFQESIDGGYESEAESATPPPRVNVFKRSFKPLRRLRSSLPNVALTSNFLAPPEGDHMRAQVSA